MKLIFFKVVLVTAVCGLFVRDVVSRAITSSTDALSYLTQFGHMPSTALGSAAAATVDRRTALRESLLSFQHMAGIDETGVLDEKTMEWMNKPRCGLPDNVRTSGGRPAETRRRKRYDPQGSRWSKTRLTYNFTNYTARLPQSVVRNVVQTAFQFWSDNSALTFTESSAADIQFLYKAGAHGDEYPFDGRGGTLAHAFFPDSGSLRGDAHFDEDEPWTDGTSSGTNLLQVTTHELGHSLGLSHSAVPGAVMAPFYSGYNRNFRLTADDIAGIQYLYGPKDSATTTTTTPTTTTTTTRTTATTTTARTTTTTASRVSATTTTTTPSRTSTTTTTTPSRTTTTTTTATPVQSICNNAVPDAMVVIGGTTYAFQGAMYYILNDYGIQVGYPQRIVDQWPAVGGYVDTVLFFEPQAGDTGALYFFKGTRFWKYSTLTTLIPGYPKYIRDGFTGVPDYLDAAFVWSNGKIYFVKGNEYYRYTRGVGTDDGYPRSMSIWLGVPTPIVTAFQWTNQRTFFFVGDQYYRFNDAAVQIDSGYPRPTNYWWFGCPASNRAPSSLTAGDDNGPVAAAQTRQHEDPDTPSGVHKQLDEAGGIWTRAQGAAPSADGTQANSATKSRLAPLSLSYPALVALVFHVVKSSMRS